MRPALWLSIMPFLGFWLWQVGVYGSQKDFVLAMLSLLLGIAACICGALKIEASIDKRLAILAAPLLLSCLVIPYPYNTGLAISAVALAISVLAPGRKAIWMGALFSGLFLSSQALALSIYFILAPSLHSAGWLSPLLAFASNLAGFQTAYNDNIVYVYALERTFPFTITLEKLGFYPWILIFSIACVLAYSTSQDAFKAAKQVAGIAILSSIYLILRYLVLLSVFFATDMPERPVSRMDIFISPIWLLGSFIPLVLMIYIIYPIQNFNFDFSLGVGKKGALGFFAILLSFFLLTCAFIYQDPGIEKNGRILVDEIHSIWEFSTLKLDKQWYGVNSTYNSYSMVEWLADSYDVDRIVGPAYRYWNVSGAAKVVPDLVSDKITYDILNNYDILLIKTPSRYLPEEVEAIVSFVENGGGLFLIGDHTNFAGSGTNLNQLSKIFGIEFGFDSVNTQAGGLFHYNRSAFPHPCIKYMPYLDFMTGCSIRAPLNGEPIILGFGLNAVPGEYSSTGFFRETRANDPTQVTDTTWGLINQAVALKHRKGRVIAFSDSTIISNFRVFFGGTPNFVRGCIEYLNYSNRYENTKIILFIMGLLSGFFAAFLLRGENIWGNKRMTALLITLSICSISVSGAFFCSSIESMDSLPDYCFAKNRTICFDGQHSTQIVSERGVPGEFETFFIWTQRVGLTPTVEKKLGEAMHKGRVVVIVNPTKSFSSQEIDSLKDYIMEGGHVLLMVNSMAYGWELARSFGINASIIEGPNHAQNRAKSQKKIQNQIVPENGKGLPIQPWGLSIEGGRSLLSIDERNVLAEASYGRGKFILFTDSHIFKNGFSGKPGFMGHSNSDPNILRNLEYDIEALYRLEYEILEYLLNGVG